MANANNGSFQSDQLPGIFNVLDDKDDAYIAELFPQLLDGSTAGNINMMDSSLNQAAPYAIRPDFVVPQQAIPRPSASQQRAKRKADTCQSIEAHYDETAKVSNINSYDDFGQIDIIYFGQIQKSTTYRFETKLHLYDRSDPESKEGELLPRTDDHLKSASEKDADQAKKILEPKNIRGGLILEYENGNIYATRRCLVNIFYSNFFNQSVCTKLVRNERTLIFSRDDFDASWRSYKHGSSKMPSNEVYLGFARQWFFQGKSQLPITAVVKSRRYQSLVDTARMDIDMSGLQISVEPSHGGVNPNPTGHRMHPQAQFTTTPAQAPPAVPAFFSNNVPNISMRQQHMTAPLPSHSTLPGMDMSRAYSQEAMSPLMISRQSSGRPTP